MQSAVIPGTAFRAEEANDLHVKGYLQRLVGPIFSKWL